MELLAVNVWGCVEEAIMVYNCTVTCLQNLQVFASKTSAQAGAVPMPLAMFLLSLKSIRVLSIMNFILKLAYLYKVTEKKRLIYMHLL